MIIFLILLYLWIIFTRHIVLHTVKYKLPNILKFLIRFLNSINFSTLMSNIFLSFFDWFTFSHLDFNYSIYIFFDAQLKDIVFLKKKKGLCDIYGFFFLSTDDFYTEYTHFFMFTINMNQKYTINKFYIVQILWNF